jgi:uncharacterized protein YcfJ
MFHFASGEQDMNSTIKGIAAILLTVVLAVVLAGCEGQPLSEREKGTLVGGGLGAATGAIIGSAVGSPGSGAAIGGALGAATGMLAGHELQNRDVRYEQLEAQLRQQQRELEEQRRELAMLRGAEL